MAADGSVPLRPLQDDGIVLFIQRQELVFDLHVQPGIADVNGALFSGVIAELFALRIAEVFNP